jgi:hypothetical protein
MTAVSVLLMQGCNPQAYRPRIHRGEATPRQIPVAPGKSLGFSGSRLPGDPCDEPRPGERPVVQYRPTERPAASATPLQALTSSMLLGLLSTMTLNRFEPQEIAIFL